MSNNALLAVAIGAAVFLVVQRQAQAGTTTAGGVKVVTPAQVNAGRQQSANVNADMWKRLLGSSWGDMAAGAAGIAKNAFGQATTSDGKPISTGDPLGFYYQLQAGDATELPGSLIEDTRLPGGNPVEGLLQWDTDGNEGYSWSDIAGLV